MNTSSSKIKKSRQKFARTTIQSERISSELTDIYQNPDGTLPDMHHIEKRQRSFFARFFGFVLVLCVVFGLGAGVYFVLFERPGASPTSDVMLEIVGMKEASAGQEVEFRIRYRNLLDTALKSSRIEVRYPEGFVPKEWSVEPTDTQLPIWDLGALEAGAFGTIEIRGTLFGALAEEQSLRAFFHYEPANFSSSFQQVATFVTTVTSSPAKIVFEAPTSTVSGSSVPITMFVTQEISNPSPDVPLVLSLESLGNFQVVTSDPAKTNDPGAQWIIDPAKKETKIQVTAIFSEESSGIQTLTAKLVGAHMVAHAPQEWAVATHEVSVEKADITLTLVVNGAAADATLAPGEPMNVRLVLKNNSSATIENASLALDVEAPSDGKKSIFDWNNIDDQKDGAIVGEQLSNTVRRGRITWDKSKIDELASLPVGKEVALDLQLSVFSGDVVDLSSYETYVGLVKSSVTFTLQGTEKKSIADDIALTFVDDLSLEVSHEKKSLNNKSVHMVTWLLSHSYHELKDITLEADLYGDVTFLESQATVPAGKVSYDATAKKVLWTIETMPVSVDVLALTLPIQIDTANPSQKNLTSKVKIKATDMVTGTEIFRVGDEVLF